LSPWDTHATDRKMISSWVAAWQRAGPESERPRREELQQAETFVSTRGFVLNAPY